MEIKINELYELDGISWKHKYKEYKIHTHIDSISLCLVTYTRFLNKKKIIIIANIDEEDIQKLDVFGIKIIKSHLYKPHKIDLEQL